MDQQDQNKDIILSFDRVGHRYNEKIVLESISEDIYRNKFITVIGPSGCGKSTLLYITAGLIKPTEGRVIYEGVEVKEPNPRKGMVFQQDAVFPWLTVHENIEFGLKIRNISEKERSQIVKRYIELVELQGCENLLPRELSGGMRKRVDLARALATNPDILLLDEPFGFLDAQTKENMQIELLQIWGQERKTSIFVTHDIEEAIFIADEVLVMSKSPGTFKERIEIPFPRPRDMTLKMSSEFQKLRYELRKLLE